MARRRTFKPVRWLVAAALSGAYLGVVATAVPFLTALSTSPPWGWLMLIALLYLGFAALSVITHLWGVNLRMKILFIPF
jgi:hypothetical protein